MPLLQVRKNKHDEDKKQDNVPRMQFKKFVRQKNQYNL